MSKSLPPYGYLPYDYLPYDYLPYGYSPHGYLPYDYLPYDYLLYGYSPHGYLPYGYLPYGYLPSLCIIPALWDIFQFKYQKQTPVIKTLTMVAMMHVLRLNPANRLP